MVGIEISPGGMHGGKVSSCALGKSTPKRAYVI